MLMKPTRMHAGKMPGSQRQMAKSKSPRKRKVGNRQGAMEKPSGRTR